MCVASGKCKNCDADVSDIATVTYAVKKAPTCLNAGTGTYTATFSAAYGFPRRPRTFSFLPSAIPGVRQRIHGRRPKPAIPVPRSASARMTLHTWRTRLSRRLIRLSPSRPVLRLAWGDIRFPFKADWAKDASKDVSIPALGHDWGKWTSNGDGTHTHVCKRDKTHTGDGQLLRRHRHLHGESNLRRLRRQIRRKRIPTTTPARRNGRPPRPPTSRNGRAAGEVVVAPRSPIPSANGSSPKKATFRKDGEKDPHL